MSIYELALAIALGIAIVIIIPFLVLCVIIGIISVPCSIYEHFKEIEKGEKGS